jgi:hypothetical protein
MAVSPYWIRPRRNPILSGNAAHPDAVPPLRLVLSARHNKPKWQIGDAPVSALEKNQDAQEDASMHTQENTDA